MNLLEKFQSVTIQTDNRITEGDKHFCHQHQQAYEAALASFKELRFFWEDMERVQRELLLGLVESERYTSQYLSSSEGPTISNERIRDHIAAIHHDFVVNLVHYFNRTYHVKLEGRDILDRLLPSKPERSWRSNEEEWDAYYTRMAELSLTYQRIVDLLLVQLDGRSFAEQAFHELAAKCHNAAWSSYQKEPKFERKKNIFRFTSYGCSCRDGYQSEYWELSDNMKDILRGIAHYETGCFKVYPLGFGELLGYGHTNGNEHIFSTCTKVASLKMFKNGRVDVKFATEAHAEEFVSTYIGTVC